MKEILFIEDDKNQLEYLITKALEINPYIEIKHAKSCKEAIEIANIYKIEAFFIDVQLPDGDGISLAKKLRETKQYMFTPMVFITGVFTKKMEAFREIHCYDYIIKPFSPDTLEKVMRSILVNYLEADIECKDNYLLLDFRGVKQKIRVSEILYMEYRQRRIFIITKYEEIAYKHISIKNFKIDLPSDFVQAHQSFIVNKNSVSKVDVSEASIKMNSKKELIPIGANYRAIARELINANT
ncbi:MAG: LytR/AlgR family response regulator transcription factor [Alkaliphilus sp.]